MLKSSILSLLLRSFSLASRFVLLLSMVRFLSPAEVGIYGLFVVLIGLMLYFVGLDFYTFNTRELLAGDTAAITPLIRDQMVLHCILYILILPILKVLFVTEFLPKQHLYWIFPILVAEHLSQESYRLFVTLSRPIVANIILFMRNGAWAYAVVIIMWSEKSTRTLQTIWIAWFIGGVIAIVATIIFLLHLDWSIARHQRIDWKWLQRGICQSMFFLGATLALRAVEFSDRFFIEFYYNSSLVGVYTFYSGIAKIIFTFISTGIFMIYHPMIVRSFQQQDYASYKHAFRRMSFLAVSGIFVIAVMVSGGMIILLHFLNRPIYEMYLPAFFMLIANVSIIVISQLPHYGLFVRRQDKSLFFSSLLSLVVALILNALWVPTYHIYGAALSTIVAMIVLTLSKYIFLLRYTRYHGYHAKT